MESTIDKSGKSRIKPILIEEELKTSFLDYSMSVIISRAIPDVRDGLKPVHRRVLYTMDQLGFTYNKPYHKSVRVVGDVLGKYHPHGDQAVYNTMVGMVQPFSKRYPLLDGQGNWGSVDGDNAAAMRYTEVRMQKISQEILADLDKETVDFVPNFDESTVEPVILPSKLPNLLVNGTAGIAVGMATSIPPHNLGEVINGCLAYLEDETVSDEKLFKLIPAPDFPTGGIICGRSGIIRAYSTGRGNLVLRGVVAIEETTKVSKLIITELPYQVNKAELIIRIADLVKDKIIEGISNIRDESDKNIRVVIDLKRGETPTVILNQLYKHTPLQTTVGILMLALLDNRPLVFTLRQLIKEFLVHRQVIITKRCQFELAKAQAREHILLGFLIALDNIDEVVALIKASENADIALDKLRARFGLSLEQGKAILEMRLQRLTGLEQGKIREELESIKVLIAGLKAILADTALLKEEIRKELIELRETYADKRRSRIEGAVDNIEEADLVPDEEVVVTLTSKGYVKRVLLSTYGVQHRGGKGKMGMTALEESDDMLQDIFIARTHDSLLFFTNKGRVFSLPVYQIPEASRIAKGRALVNIIALGQDEKVVKLLCTRDLGDDRFLVMVTKEGTIKRTEASEFSKIRSTGIRAINLKESDELVFCAISTGKDNIVIATANGQGIHFPEQEVRSMGRTAAGVRGVNLRNNDYVVGLELVQADQDLLFVTEHGFGKRVRVADFRITHRGGLGVRTIPTDKRNGQAIGLAVVDDESNVLLIDNQGKIIRLSPSEIRTMGRQAKGVRLIRLSDGRTLAGVAAFTGDGSAVDKGLIEAASVSEAEGKPPIIEHDGPSAGEESDE